MTIKRIVRQLIKRKERKRNKITIGDTELTGFGRGENRWGKLRESSGATDVSGTYDNRPGCDTRW